MHKNLFADSEETLRKKSNVNTNEFFHQLLTQLFLCMVPAHYHDVSDIISRGMYYSIKSKILQGFLAKSSTRNILKITNNVEQTKKNIEFKESIYCNGTRHEVIEFGKKCCKTTL